MSGPLDGWTEKYRNSIELVDNTSEVLTGFNANLDIIHRDTVKTDRNPELLDFIDSDKELESALNYCIENGENHEIDYSGFDITGGEKYIGGQGGIVSNYLAKTGNSAILYTPYLSQDLAEMIDERVLYPVYEDENFVLKSVRDAVNSDRTKKNHIFEFKAERTGRLILSDSLKGYGPYLPKQLEDNLELLEENVDCCFFSGFHSASGNTEAKIMKAEKQLSRIDKPIHLEYVHDPETSEKVVEMIVPEVDSLGLDETELSLLCDMNDIDIVEEPNFGEAFAALKKLKDGLGLTRIHLHTYRYHIAVADEDYQASLGQMRDSMLYGELSAIQSAENGEIPDTEAIQEFDMSGKHLQGIEELEDFGSFHGIEDFSEKGVAEIEGLKVVGIPVIIHEDPARTVGMGDLISSGAFCTENSLSQDF